MYSCANYPRGCRGRVNRQGAKCSDCVVCDPLDLYLLNCLCKKKVQRILYKKILTHFDSL
ncbi:hypothetical protein PITC_025000 [Penicillium italicum]|uniref:Uncharacterized protein n=1 Tax=Penicillium italicum TaxID=40296 RepID=A0A0A2LCX6_PENIT|nr:hypothetical protein PITC_025000 [Penicillium italicum]